MKVRSLNPLAGLFGPIFQKEVRASGRRRGTYILRALYAAGLLALMCVAFWGIQIDEAYTSTLQRIETLQQLAPAMTMVIMWFQAIAMSLIAPMLAAPAICDERRARSLATLLTTPLTSAQIILGKLSSRLVQLVIIALLTMPVLLAIRVFGGLSAEVVLAFTSVSLSLGILGAAFAIMYSIWHTRATSAALFALLSLALAQLAPSAVEGIIYYIMNYYVLTSGTYEVHEQVFATAAPYALVGLSEHLITGQEIPWFQIHWPWLFERLSTPAGTNAVGVVSLAPVWLVNVIYNLIVAGLATSISIVAMRRLMLREAGEGARAAAPAKSRRKRRKAKESVPPAAESAHGESPDQSLAPTPAPAPEDELLFAAPIDEPTRDRAASRIVSDRPVLWREIRRTAIRSRWLRVGIALAAVGGIAALYAFVGIEEEGLQMTFAVLTGLIVMIQAIFMTTGSISAEREGRTWEVLLTTPLTARDIILGKFLGAFRAQWFLPILLLIHLAISASVGVLPWRILGQMTLILLGPMLFFTATGQFLSLAFRRGITGSVLNLILGLFIWIGLWIILGLIGWFGDFTDHEWADEVAKFPYSLNPLLMAGSACEPAVRIRSAQNLRYDMIDANVTALEFNTWIIVGFVTYALLAALALFATIASFRRLSGRSS